MKLIMWKKHLQNYYAFVDKQDSTENTNSQSPKWNNKKLL